MSDNHHSQRFKQAGAWASLGCAATFVFGFVLLIARFLPYVDHQRDAAFAVEFAVHNHALLSVWHFVIYILFGVLFLVLALALHHRLSPVSPVLSQFGTALALVWVGLVIASGMVANVGLQRVVELAPLQSDQAQALWLATSMVTDGLGGGNEIVGGLWLIAICSAAWKARVYPRFVCEIGLVAGTAGVLSTIPVLSDLGPVFGLLLIVWFVCQCIVMRREVSIELNIDTSDPNL